MKAYELWNKFTNKKHIYQICQFGGNDIEIDQLAFLILNDVKVVTSSAYKEKEGNKTLDYWRRIHQQFFEKELSLYNQKFSFDMLVVCEEFKVVYK